MRVERAINLRSAIVQRVRDAYSVAHSCSLTSDALNEKLRVAFETPKGAPGWIREYARGYSAALSDALYRDSLVFGGMVDGVFYSTHRNRADYYEKHGIEPSAYADNGKVTARGHYWAHTLRPFFLSKEA